VIVRVRVKVRVKGRVLKRFRDSLSTIENVELEAN